MRPSWLAEQWQRNAFAATFGVFLGVMGFTFTLPFLPLYFQEAAGLDPDEAAFWAGMSHGLAGAGTFVAGPIWGVLGDRLGRKPMLVRAQCGAALATLIFVFAHDVPMIVLARVAVGVIGGSSVAAMSLIASTAPKDKLPRALGTFQAAQMTAVAMGPVFGGTLAEFLGFRTTFLVVSLVMLSGGIILLLMTREGPRERSPRHVPGQPRPGGEIARMLHSQMLLVVLCASLLFAFARPMVQPVLPSFTQSLLSPDAPRNLVVGGLFFGMGLVGAVAALGTSRFAARIGLTRALIIAAVGSGLFILPLGASQNAVQLFFFALTMAVFNGALQTTSTALLSSVAPRTAISSSFGIFQSVQAAGSALGPIASGSLAVAVGIPWVFAMAGAIFIAGGMIVLAAARRGMMTPAKSPAPEPSAGHP